VIAAVARGFIRRRYIARFVSQLVERNLVCAAILSLALIQCDANPVQIIGGERRLANEREDLIHSDLGLPIGIERTTIGFVSGHTRSCNQRVSDQL